jgi:hypothetical protein
MRRLCLFRRRCGIEPTVSPPEGWTRDVVPDDHTGIMRDADDNRIGRRAGLGDYCMLPEA